MYRITENSKATRQRLIEIVKAFRIYAAFIALVAILTTGCEPQLQTGYGRASGLEHTGSVNGTVIFHKMLKSSDRKVHRYSQLSPRWEKYQTIYWMPDNFEPPEQDIVDRIDEWLTNDSYRTFVYVCRDYDASIQYWEALKNREADPGKANELNRLYINAMCEHVNHRNIFPDNSCGWFDTEMYPFTKATQFSGELSRSLDLVGADIRYSRLAKPGDVTNTGQFGEYDTTVLMSVDSHPFIYELTSSQFDESRIIVISNASFLLNLSLTNAKNRELASSLIEYIGNYEDPFDDILFIESDQRLPISDRDSRDKYSQWSWITKKPMRYIVPNLLICFIMLCFVYYPIFGRPKRIKRSSTANFRDHIYALGQLIKKSKTRLIPNTWIEEYRRRVSGTRAPQITEPKVENKNREDETS